jgi:hypothetical protein
MDYINKGYNHPSVTKEVKNNAALTELSLKSTNPLKKKNLKLNLITNIFHHKTKKKL